jgi:histidinol-phosphate aminotransferase
LINEAIRVNAKMIYFANPDNPMGTFHSKKVMQELLDNLPESTLLCLDEAYSDFVEKEELTPLDVSNRNVIRLRTFSKAYGLAGLRIGYGIGSESLISEFNKVRNHFGVNKIAQIAAVTSLHDQDHLKKVKLAVEDSKISIKKIFGRYGFSCLNSKTNFLAIDCGKDSHYATKLLKELIREKIFVRMPAVHPLNSFIRVSTGRSKDLKELDLALSKVMKRI